MIGAEEGAILTAQRKLGMANERTQQLLTDLLRPFTEKYAVLVPANKLNNPMRLTKTGVTSSSSTKSASRHHARLLRVKRVSPSLD